MSPRSPEPGYIHEIDRNKREADQWSDEKRFESGLTAESVVIDFFQSNFPNFEARPATAEEDRGYDQISTGKRIDAVLYQDKKPSAGLQITTTTTTEGRMKRMQALKDQPFVRLDEMKNQDPSIPKAIIPVEELEITAFLNDRDWTKHPKLTEQILDGMENSLKFDLLQTKNPKQQAMVQELLNLILKQKAEIKKGETIH